MVLTNKGMSVVLIEPSIHIEMVVLLGPQHSSQRLTVDAPFILAQRTRRDSRIEFVRIGNPGRKDLIESSKSVEPNFGGQSQANDLTFSFWNLQTVNSRR